MRTEAPLRWLQLLALTLVLSLLLLGAGMSAAWLLGAMAASIILSVRGISPRLPGKAVFLAQGMVGLLVAAGLHADAFRQVADHALLFGGVVLAVVAISVALGAVLYRLRVLPGTSALWGVFPGAASAMTLMAEAHGADVRYVALMQYLRVAVVVMAATTVMHAVPTVAPASAIAAASAVASTAAEPHGLARWLPLLAIAPFDALELAKTLLLAAGAVSASLLLRWPAGTLLAPMVLGVAAQYVGWLRITQPAWLMTVVYCVIGWSIGRRFSRDVVRHAWRSLPWLLGSTLCLVAACAALGGALSRWGGVDPLTAYLATSPGGLDAVAILAASADVDIPFVMGLQTARLLFLLLAGPAIVRAVVRLALRFQPPAR